MSAVEWLVACAWVLGIVVLMALILAAIAFADPRFRHGLREPRPGADEPAAPAGGDAAG
ncbi:MAG: hypothetical protein ABSA40_05970 [Candidatus Dormibacteria bacterium]|jgi:hypothetical protein